MRPSLVLVWAFGVVLAVLAVADAAFPEMALWWWLPLPAVGLPALIDGVLTLRGPRPHLVRTLAPVLTLGHRTTVAVTLGPGLVPGRLYTVFDGVPPSFRALGQPWKGRAASGVLGFRYEAVPGLRGTFEFGPAWVDQGSLLGFWIRRHRPGPLQTVRVFPDLRPLLGDHLSLAAGTPGAGSHQVRRRGQGLEFHQLREYRQGDMARMVDGKASSRLQRLVVREMQEEQDQTVVFLLDTGYRMTDAEGGVRHFDRAFDAVLALAAVALRQGDRVGVQTWGPDQRWVPPVRGREAFPSLVEKIFDLQARPEASSPVAALQELLPRLTRRTLVFLMTNFREEDAEDLAPLLALYRTKHLLCTVWLRERIVDEWKERNPQTLDEALGTVMAVRFDQERARGRRLSEAQGLLTLDVTPGALRGELIHQYWTIKKRGLL